MSRSPGKSEAKRLYDAARYALVREKKCANAKEWYYKNRAAVLERRAAEYAADPDAHNAKLKAYRAANIDIFHERERLASREKYRLDREKCLARSKASTSRARELDPERFAQQAHSRYWKDPEKSRERGRLDAMNRRAGRRGKSGYVSVGAFEILWGRQRGVCALCWRPLGDAETPHVDHWVPLARGGEHDLDNLRLLHRACNLKKWAKLPAELVPAFILATENHHAF